ncbi:MAG: excinuclease ABC subunit UvrC [Gemmatimonadetes bacterium]|nr:excinuclease ABC subunit UvrC [Gemmatimonadota bacterium]
MNETLDRKLRHLPTSPGVYLFKDAAGEIIYIGKAKSLRSRVRGHFSADPAWSPKQEEMVRRIADVDTMVVGSEAEALLLESNLVKTHQPRFNIRLKDDKRFPYIKVTVGEAFPRVYVTRQVENDGARYFGPYTEVGAMRTALEVVKRAYTVRSCRYDLPSETPDRPCLDYHIGRCRAPCVGLQSAAEYRGMTEEILQVLGGDVSGVRQRVMDELAERVTNLDFERAATLRDTLVGLDSIERRQRALDVRGGDQDVVGFARDGDNASAVLLRIRGGKLLGRAVDHFTNLETEDEAAVLSAVATRFYLGRGEVGFEDLPREVLIPLEFEDQAALEELLNESSRRRLSIHVPQRGEKRRLVELASQNARHVLEERSVMDESVRARADDVVYELQEALELKVVPRLMVCFDISHTQGSELVGSAVVFENGEPKKSEYRRFRIRGDWRNRSPGRAQVEDGGTSRGGPIVLNDDFRSMEEVVGRYFRRRMEEGLPLPDLAVIDGGKGQLSSAAAALAAAGATDVALCALAKRDEEIFLRDRGDAVRLPRTHVGLRLLQRIRNEAHRFAVGYNRNLRGKRTLSSELAEIPGVGPKRQRALLTRFGSVRALRQASLEEVAAVPGFSQALGRRILEHLEEH